MPTKPSAADGAAFKQFKQDLSAGTLGRLYVFHGEEAYLRDHYLGQMKAKLLPPGMEEFNLHTFQAKECEPKRLEQAVDCLPMMSQRTLILVYDYDLFKANAADKDALTALFSDLPDYVCMVFVCDLIEYKPDARTKLAAAIKQNGAAIRFTRQEQGDLVDWIRRRFRAQDHDIDSELARYLIFLCGDLMTGLISEIGKIGAYATHKIVTREDIDAVATPQLDAVVFQLTDAITAGNFEKAASVMGDLLHMGEPPIKILSVLGRQLRQLYSARLAMEQRKGSNYLVELWGLRSAYPAQKLMDAARRFDLNWCRMAVTEAAKADLAMKSVSGADGEELLIELLLKLANTKPK